MPVQTFEGVSMGLRWGGGGGGKEGDLSVQSPLSHDQNLCVFSLLGIKHNIMYGIQGDTMSLLFTFLVLSEGQERVVLFIQFDW